MQDGYSARILYVSRFNKVDDDLPDVFLNALSSVGEPLIITEEELADSKAAQEIRRADVLLVCRHSLMVPEEVAADPGKLKLIVATVGSLQPYVPKSIIAAGIDVCNWGDAPAGEIAAGALTLTLAVLADLHHHIQERRRGGWKIDKSTHGGSLLGETVGLYGYGLIAQRFRELLRPFDCGIIVYDPYASDLPADVIRVDSLNELFSRCRVVSIHAGLTAETRRSVTRTHLQLMEDDGVIINTARGAIIDQPALFEELSSGRLRAGLDVLDDPDELSPAHPARSWENLILTGHQIHLGWPQHGEPPQQLTTAQRYAVENIGALIDKRSFRWRITERQFDRMT